MTRNAALPWVALLVFGMGWGILQPLTKIAAVGTLIPHFTSYTAIAHLPAGLIAIILALILIFALTLGAVFASQTAYLVTGFGVVWSMLLIGERYSGWVRVALALILVGLTLVRPAKHPLARPRASRETV